ncbi:hypothetical protein Acr_03g0015740 [Actinidia rufa]|uniref:Uncharacterized protein n=1 Tax=Actinidia rufa TaxID=165716 RepID=A0A7J0EEK6_9ERIC|nr:hypothetical protein Acr_03g0015740 [Actinidia rufa]
MMGRTEAELSLLSKLSSPLHRSSVQSQPKTTAVRAEVIVSAELSLLNKLEAITALELGRGAMADSNPRGVRRHKLGHRWFDKQQAEATYTTIEAILDFLLSSIISFKQTTPQGCFG